MFYLFQVKLNIHKLRNPIQPPSYSSEHYLAKQKGANRHFQQQHVWLAHFWAISGHFGLFGPETAIFWTCGSVPDFWDQSLETPENPDFIRDFGGLVHLWSVFPVLDFFWTSQPHPLRQMVFAMTGMWFYCSMQSDTSEMLFAIPRSIIWSFLIFYSTLCPDLPTPVVPILGTQQIKLLFVWYAVGNTLRKYILVICNRYSINLHGWHRGSSTSFR